MTAPESVAADPATTRIRLRRGSGYDADPATTRIRLRRGPGYDADPATTRDAAELDELRTGGCSRESIHRELPR
jgi:hypothetical protein